MVDLLQNESEGIIRKEAALLLIAIYEHNKIDNSQLECVYMTMAHAAMNDLFWEVKVKAIDFWNLVIKRELARQGVIDGGFPSVTFSIEKKKIVTLTRKEITLRLTEVLNKMSAVGCLGVLLSCLSDDADLMVIKAAVHVINLFVKFMDKYNYWNELKNYPTPSTSAQKSKKTEAESKANECSVRSENQIAEDFSRSEEVIQSIVSSDDINLLSEAYMNQLNVDEEEKPNDPNDEYFKNSIKVEPIDFLNAVRTTDLNELVKMKAKWLECTETFDTLLNDMMDALQVIPANEADCY